MDSGELQSQSYQRVYYYIKAVPEKTVSVIDSPEQDVGSPEQDMMMDALPMEAMSLPIEAPLVESKFTASESVAVMKTYSEEVVPVSHPVAYVEEAIPMRALSYPVLEDPILEEAATDDLDDFTFNSNDSKCSPEECLELLVRCVSLQQMLK